VLPVWVAPRRAFFQSRHAFQFLGCPSSFSLAKMIGNKGKVWLICTSQLELEKVVDRTNFQPALVGRLNARFDLKPQLISDEINKVVAERILKKHPSEEVKVLDLYQAGWIAQLADLKASRHGSSPGCCR
jgi:hypothetical protein